MLHTIQRYIDRHQLLNRQQLYLVALSGGADSVALLRLLQSLGYRIEAVHCNFHLRGTESDRDEAFAAQVCQQQNVPFHRVHFDTKTYAQLHKVSIEMAARELRYRYFEQLRKDIGAEGICVAHHRDDNVETLLINLIRGTGIHGLVGIRPRQGRILRPLLCVSRQQIESYLQHIGQQYVTDSTNLVDNVVRNKIRLNVIPLLKTINPHVVEMLQATTERMTEAERVYQYSIDNEIKSITTDNTLNICKLSEYTSPESLLFEWLRKYNFTAATIEQIYEHIGSSTGHVWSSPTHELLINRGQLIVAPKEPPITPLQIPEPGCYVISDGRKIHVAISTELTIIRKPSHACLDADKVTFPLTIRPIKEGDRFIPFGMKGSKLISDYLTDYKLSLFERRRQLVVSDASGNILWLAGQRPDQRFSIGPETRRMLVIHI